MSEETIPQMREQIEALSKEKKDLQKSNTELASENRKLKGREASRGAKVSEKVGELYAAQNPDGEITVEAVAAFAQEYGFPTVETKAPEEGQQSEGTDEEGSQTPAAPGSPDLANLARGGSRAGEGGAGGSSSEPMTIQEWRELRQKDPAAAAAAVRQGRISISGNNPWLRSPTKATGNPYVPVVKS